MVIRPESVRISLWAVLGLWLARRLGRLLVLIVRSPSAVFGIVLGSAAVAGWHYVSPTLPLGVLSGLIAALVVWRLRWPGTFEPQVSLRFRTWDRLAQTFGALDCRVRSVRRRRQMVELWFLTDDPLEATVAPFEPDPDALTKGIPIALCEDGAVFRLRLVGSHLLVVGATGAGKGSVIAAIIAGLVPFIASGVVRIWAVDPEGWHGARADPAPVRPLRPRRRISLGRL